MEDELLDDLELTGSFTFDELSNTTEEQEQEEEEQHEEESQSEESQEDTTEGEESNDEQASTSEEEVDEDEVSYSGLIDHWVEAGVIPEDLDLEIEDSEEGLVQIFEAVVEKKFDSLLDQLSPKARQLLEVELNGGDIEEAFTTFNDINYEDVDIEDEDVRKELLTDYYKEKFPKLSDDKIEKKVTNVIDLGEDTEEAQEAKDYFIEKQELIKKEYIEQLKAQQEEQEQLIQKQLDEYHGIIDKVDGFNGLNFTSKKEKEEFRAYLFDRGKDGLTQAERDDLNKETRLAKEFYKFKKFSFEHIEKKSKTKATVELKKLASRHQDPNATSSGKQENTRRTNNGFKLGELI